MASSDPVGDGYAMLTSVLRGDATFMSYLPGGLWQGAAPPGTATDYALLVNMSATEVNAATASRIMTTLIYQVRVVGPAQDEATLRAAYVRADSLLQPNGRALRNTAGTLSCFRVQTIEQNPTINGVQWLILIGLYRVEV